jgi:methionine-S-sulfoxide reductase
MSIATLGGGCFWCVEAVFELIEGVQSVMSGYSGGDQATANYKMVCSGTTKHAEVVQVHFDPKLITYREILEIFFATHDPTTPNRQGNDVGPQYRSVVFYENEEQREIAEEVKADYAPQVWDDPIVTQIVPLEKFFQAEEYHHGYYEKVGGRNPYCSFVITPKVSKARKLFAHKMKAKS